VQHLEHKNNQKNWLQKINGHLGPEKYFRSKNFHGKKKEVVPNKKCSEKLFQKKKNGKIKKTVKISRGSIRRAILWRLYLLGFKYIIILSTSHYTHVN
jgi:hypothetical protein